MHTLDYREPYLPAAAGNSSHVTPIPRKWRPSTLSPCTARSLGCGLDAACLFCSAADRLSTGYSTKCREAISDTVGAKS